MSVQALLAEAWADFQARRFPSALQGAQGVLDAEPDHPLAHIIAGGSLRHLGRRADSALHLGRAAALAPQWALPHAALAAAHRGWGQYARAERHGLEAVTVQPSESVGWCELALVYQDRGDQVNARRCATQALVLEPGSAIASTLLSVPALDLAAAALDAQPTETLFQRNLHAALRQRAVAYCLLTLSCEMSRRLSGFLGGALGTLAAGLLGLMTILVLIDPYQDIRPAWLGLMAWLILVCWPALKLHEWLTWRDLPRLARVIAPRAGRGAVATGPALRRLGWLALALGSGAALIAMGLRQALVETFLGAFVTNTVILLGTSQLVLTVIDLVQRRRRRDRLDARQTPR